VPSSFSSHSPSLISLAARHRDKKLLFLSSLIRSSFSSLFVILYAINRKMSSRKRRGKNNREGVTSAVKEGILEFEQKD